jgi:dihydropyrimidinase
MDYDMVIRNGTVVTASDSSRCDIGVKNGRITTLADHLPPAPQDIDASDKLVLPGGIDSHCHIEQKSSSGIMCADDFYSGSVSAAFGGTTTIIPFAAQHRGDSLRDVVHDYHMCAEPKAVIDYAFHLIITDPTESILNEELPALIQEGYTSFKVYLTYDLMKIDDYEMLDILALARREQAMVMVHAENHDIIRWMSTRLLDGGHAAPKFHAIAHARIAEDEATNRAIRLAELLDTPLLFVHVSAPGAIDAIRAAQTQGLRIYGETCPQYVTLTAQDLDLPGMEGAKFCCSPPPRDAAAQEAVWQGLRNGTFQVFSSDHAPYRFDETGKLAKGPEATFKDIANGLPGLELRQPILFSEGVNKGRIDVHQFVALTSTNAAKIYGLHPRKGTIAVGADADLAIWDPHKDVTVRSEMLNDNVGYSPYEGRTLTGWPVTVISRGRVVVDQGVLQVERGSGTFLPCGLPQPAKPLGRRPSELDPNRNFGAEIL